MRFYSVIVTLVIMFVCGVAIGSNCATDGAKCPTSAEGKAACSAKAAAENGGKCSKSVDGKIACSVKDAVDKVIVTVNGDKIMQSEVDAKIEPQLAQMKAMGREPDEAMKDSFRKRTAEFMIIEALVKDALAKNKVKITDEQVKEKIAEIAGQEGMTVEKFEEMVLSRGQITVDELKEQIKLSMGFEKLVEKEMAKGGKEITEADVKKFYDENIARFTTAEKVRASHILIGTQELDKLDADAKTKGKTEAKAKANDILKKVKAGGDFAKLAEENSTCPSKAKGGDLDFFEKGRMVPAFSDAAFALKVGEISGIVETPFGYHIIKVTDKQEAGSRSFEMEKVKILEQLKQQEQGEFTGKFIEGLKAKAKIVWADEPKKEEAKEIKPVEKK